MNNPVQQKGDFFIHQHSNEVENTKRELGIFLFVVLSEITQSIGIYPTRK